jgi:F-type H+-transporting ATPase subunit delta
MQGSSRVAAAKAQEALDALLGEGVDAATLADELFAATSTVDGSAALRRALADPSGDGEAKRALAIRIFGGKLSDAAVRLIGELASQRWTSDRDLTDTMEGLAVQSVLAGAERDGRIDQVENELFRFERAVAADSGLRDALSVRNTDAAGKARLVATLLSGKASPETVRLASQAASAPRGRKIERTLEEYLRLAAVRREQLTAVVTSAVHLDEQQQARLRSALEGTYGKTVVLQTIVDPEVVGGIHVRVGDEVVDGTISRRIDEARRHVTGN